MKKEGFKPCRRSMSLSELPLIRTEVQAVPSYGINIRAPPCKGEGSCTCSEEWKAEHGWRTRMFMHLEHMYYSKLAWLYGAGMCAVTLLSCLAFVLGTAPDLSFTPATCPHPVCSPGPGSVCTHVICLPEPKPVLTRIEDVTVVIFLLDYLLRIATVHAVPERLIYWDGHRCHEAQTSRKVSGWYKTLDFMTHPNQLIDLIVIVPFMISEVLEHLQGNGDPVRPYMPAIIMLRLFPIARVLRVLKLGRYSEGSGLLVRTLKNSGPALCLLTLVTAVLTLVLGTFVYYAESGVFKVTPEHPDGAYYRRSLSGGWEVSPFTSIGICAYWVAVTATTVGYGDLVPTTAWGQTWAVLISYAGIVGIALPVAVVVKEFNTEYDRVKAEMEEEARMEVATQGGHAEGPEQEQAMRSMELRLFVKEQLRLAAPAWVQLWEEFALKHLEDRLQEHEKKQQQKQPVKRDFTPLPPL